MKTTVVLVVFACLVIVHVQGRALGSVRRCLCRGPGMQMVQPKNIYKIKVYPASAFCENVEIIVTLKNGPRQICLNPSTTFAQDFIKSQKRSAQ